jgi:hypothetical protein
MDALDRELHAGDPAVEMLDEMGQIARPRHEALSHDVIC